MSFYYSRKTCIFPNGLNHDSNKKLHTSFPSTFLLKRPWFCRLMMLLSQKEAFWTFEMSFYQSRKIFIFPNIFRPYFSVKETQVLSFFPQKEAFQTIKMPFYQSRKICIFLKGINFSPIFTEGRGTVHICYIKSRVHVFQSILSKPHLLNFIPFVFVFFLVDLSDKVAEKQKVCVTHAPTGGPSKETAHCGRFGTLGSKKHKIKDGARKATEDMVGFYLVFHLFCKVSSDNRWNKQ